MGVFRHMLKIISWNIARRELAWRSLLDSDADVALLQEATEPPSDVAWALAINPAPWRTAGTPDRPWRTAIVRLSERADACAGDEARRIESLIRKHGLPAAGLPLFNAVAQG